MGVAENSYFRKEAGLFASALERYDYESPAQLISFQLYKLLSNNVGFLDRDYRLSALLLRLDHGLRPRARSPYIEPWKLSTTVEERHTWLWPRIETDAYLNAHARAFWAAGGVSPPIPAEIIQMTQQLTRNAVDSIRSRGGDVIFLRPPSRGPYRQREERTAPRDRVWEPLLAAAGSKVCTRKMIQWPGSCFSRAFASLEGLLHRVHRYLCAPARSDDCAYQIAYRRSRPLTAKDCAPTAEALAVQKIVEGGAADQLM